ncbi:MAG: hypothetical protein H6662_12905 [Ardenticatenaceae bacterium]|nr:hypothetical protein [Anaerolineales bacterium]MCB8922478.1 hypothetical protein [Ardenticatenaceae bacterium]MCB8989947.1 hypothetical protein [Ardenticatenaceae bacterium]MCB9005390.1 hypothetical protein [Ardenticatenaceae bacterium]
MSKHHLGEVFGFPVDNLSNRAEHYRKNKLCPYNNKVPSCTKSKANDPIGVCSILADGVMTITCPVRFRQDWQVVSDAAQVFFPEGTNWTSLGEVRLNDADGNSAGNVDFVLVSFDDYGRILDFGALEIQSVYISGNVSNPFKYYMEDRPNRAKTDYPSNMRPDFLSSSRKRLIPQIIYKGKILNGWEKKIAVALQDTFFETLPDLPTVEPEHAELIWLIYGLNFDEKANQYTLFLKETIFTQFQPSLNKITTPPVGSPDSFIELLQDKLNEELEKETPPDTMSLTDMFVGGDKLY